MSALSRLLSLFLSMCVCVPHLTLSFNLHLSFSRDWRDYALYVLCVCVCVCECGNRLDVDSLRDRNSELREQVSELNMRVFEMMVVNNEKSRGIRAPKDDKVLPSPAHTPVTVAPRSGADSSSGDDDDDDFEDTVPNVEDAYAIHTKKKSTGGGQVSEGKGESEVKGEDEGEGAALGSPGESDTAEERLREVLAQYEKQFEIMKVVEVQQFTCRVASVFFMLCFDCDYYGC